MVLDKNIVINTFDTFMKCKPACLSKKTFFKCFTQKRSQIFIDA